MSRVEHGVTRPAAIAIDLDGEAIPACPGETVAAAMIARDRQIFRHDRAGHARGMFCNMGTCSECFVWASQSDGPWQRWRACLLAASPGLRIRTREDKP